MESIIESTFLEHVGRSEEFMRITEKRLDDMIESLAKIDKAIQVLPGLQEDVAAMKPEVERWTTARKGFYFFMFILGAAGAYIVDPLKRIFS